MNSEYLYTHNSIATLVDLLRLRAQEQAQQLGYTFLLDGENRTATLSYAELDSRARAIAAALQERGLSGQRALLLYPPGLDYVAAFFGCLYADVVAVPAYPPQFQRRAHALERLRAITSDCRPQIALTTNAVQTLAAPHLDADPAFHTLPWLATDTLDPALASAWQPASIDPQHLAFIQYTSGSTAAPKGVLLTHANLLHNSVHIARSFQHSPASVGVIWLPPYHDMGLIGGIIQPLFVGFPVVLMSPIHFLQRPLRWLNAISHYRGTTSGGPNFAYDLCVRKTTPEQRAALDLSCWDLAFNGAEPVRATTLEHFAEAFAVAGFRSTAFYPCYGLAEATLLAAGGTKGTLPTLLSVDREALAQHQAQPTPAPEGLSLVSSGAALPDQQLVIVNPAMQQRCAEGQVGEIWLAGPSIAQGYWERPDVSAQTFAARLADGSGPFLRTGDLGFLHHNDLFVTGRLKDMIIIRGRNLYPQDIERTMEQSHPALRPGGAAAFAVEHDGAERLVLVQELDRRWDTADTAAIIAAIQDQVVAQHEVPVFAIALIRHGSIAKTSSGKIQRHACRAAWLAGQLEVIAAFRSDAPDAADDLVGNAADDTALLDTPVADPQLATLQQLCGAALHITPAQLDPDQPFSRLGLDSLAAIELQYQLETELGMNVTLDQLLGGGTLRQLAAALAEQRSTVASEAMPPATDEDDNWPLTAGQQALWFLHQLTPQSTAYHIAHAARVPIALDPELLGAVVQTLLERHPALRTTIQLSADGSPVQVVQPAMPAAFTVIDASDWTEQQLAEQLAAVAAQPFDLAQGPLLRLQLYTRSARESVLLLCVHHIIADLWSLATLFNELVQLYMAAFAQIPLTLDPLPMQYRDYARQQHALLRGPAGARLWAAWQTALAGAWPPLALPTDYPPPAEPSSRGAAHTFTITQPLHERLAALAQAHDSTLFTVLLAAFQVLLGRLSGQERFLVGAPFAGRSRAALAGVVGYFVNPLPLRADLAGNPRFVDLIERVRQVMLHALAQQDYPFPLLVERLKPERVGSRTPLFQVLFVLQKAPLLDDAGLSAFALGTPDAQLSINGVPFTALALPPQAAQFDLTLMLAETGDGLTATFQYSPDLFAATTIDRLAAQFTELLHNIVADPTQPITRLALLPPDEREWLLHHGNPPTDLHPAVACLHEQVAAQTARTPTAVALSHRQGTLSYAELSCRAYQLAHYLRRYGVGPEVRVGVCLTRTPDLIVALLAVLAAGGAYVPLDPAYPTARLEQILADAQPQVLITRSDLAVARAATVPHCVLLDQDAPAIAQEATHAPTTGVLPSNLAYVLFTSGSTGRPKGVAITHASAVARLAWAETVYTPGQRGAVLAATSVSFDLSVFEIFLPLIGGGQLVLVDHALDLPAPADPTLLNTVPSAIAEILRLGLLPATVSTVNLAGEPLPASLVEALYASGTVQQVYNLYGPSEDTTYSTGALIAPDEPVPPIGRPLALTQAYVLDAQLQLVPRGVVGELYLGGVGQARGYLHRPDLTAERFVPNPFGIAGPRLYRTGDRVRWNGDGQLEFLGRVDHQVKLRGFRIELGEIAAVLEQHPQVEIAVVIQRTDTPSDPRLVAYVVPQLGNSPRQESASAALSASAAELPSTLRSFLATRLPGYMLPAAIVVLEAFPRTPNGKIDRAALPVPAASQSLGTHAIVAPRTPREAELVAIWAEVLGLATTDIGVEHNFFELGGHSLLATQLIHRVRTRYQIDVPLQSFFNAPTVAQLAVLLDQQQTATPPRNRPAIRALPRGQKNAAQFLAEIGQLPPTEAQTEPE